MNVTAAQPGAAVADMLRKQVTGCNLKTLVG